MSNDEYYWTAFCLDGHNPNELHCTHKFLGGISADDAKAVSSLLDRHFSAKPLNGITIEFDRPALFGKDADVQVLLATENTKAELGAFAALRKQLNCFRVDDFPEYKPHVTTDKTHVVARVSAYVLMRGKKALKHWNARVSNANQFTLTRLAPVTGLTDEFAELEKAIIRAFHSALYTPLLKALGVKGARLTNAKKDEPKAARDAVVDAISRDQIYTVVGKVYGGREPAVEFWSPQGTFDAKVSKTLKALGAKWNAKNGTFRIFQRDLPPDYLRKITEAGAVARGEASGRIEDVLSRLDDQIRQFLPAEIAGKIDSKRMFESSLWKTDRKIDNTLRSISVLPKLTPERTEKIATEWRDNLNLWITDFADEEIPRLRDKIQDHVMSGGRKEDIVKTLQASFGITKRKAHFLARQETNLLMAKFKESRYADAGIHEYQWRCVTGSPKHPVRPAHKSLDGKVFRFDSPPATTAPGEPQRRNNPGEDFNCRCTAVPVVRKNRKQA